MGKTKKNRSVVVVRNLPLSDQILDDEAVKPTGRVKLRKSNDDEDPVS